jgi:hypothetical protein
MDFDPNGARSMLVRRALENGIYCYLKLYEEKINAKFFQSTLDKFF